MIKKKENIMKTKILLLVIITFCSIHSIAQIQKNNKGNGLFEQQKSNRPVYLDNAITIKLIEGVGDFNKQSGTVSFGVRSLDEKISQFEVSSLDKRFRYNPDKLRQDLPDLSRIYRITFPGKYSVSELIREFASDPNIEYAEFIPINYIDDIPDDALYNQCQHLPQIFAQQAWDIHHGEDGPEIIIAIVDDGVYWKHEDLRENIWQNLGEDYDNDGKTLEFIGGEWVFDPDDINNYDDDGNGYIDDFIGWDVIENNNDPDHNSGGNHGTHCSGIAAGRTNNGVGIASISWNVKTMPVQAAAASGFLDGGYDGIIYAAENGADIISNSWSGFVYAQAEQEVVTYAQQLGSIIVAAASNDNSMQLHYPASFQGVISVASVNGDDTKAGYSNYGPAVDIAAPGGGFDGGILSTVPGNAYSLMSGTSMATPLVAGCFGLLKSYHPAWTNEQLIIQLLGSADPINSINPNYENLIGTGRVNALRFMTDVNVDMPQIMKLDYISMSYEDANGNQINEPGEEVILNIEFRNYVPFVGDDDVMATLSTEDPEITILSGSATVAIPPDGLFSIEDQFQFLVSEDATPHMAVFTISFESDIEITWGQVHTVEVLVAPGGVFIFEGVEYGQGFSGTYIKGILDQLGIPNIYSNTYPPTLSGFETVFVSQSNVGEGQDKGILFTEGQSLMFQEFLENGGNIFVDMSSMFTIIDYFGYSNAAEMKSLFGVQSNTIHFESNPVDSLYGMPGSIMEDIYFTQSKQPHTWYIDDLVLTSNAVATFTESNYGIVSAMNDGASTFGHKTYYLCYSLSELIDIDPINSKNNVLLKVLNFFEILPEEYLLPGFMADKHDGPSGMEVQFTDLSLSDPDHPIQSWAWDFGDGNTSTVQNPSYTFSEPGEHDITLIITNDLFSDTLIKHAFINVNHGFLVYEGEPDGEGYSGTFIKNYLEENNYYDIIYRNELPEDLEGYQSVFLSFGNWASGKTHLDDNMADIIINYLEGGGFVYIEGGSTFYNQRDNVEFLELFGLNEQVYPAYNPINYLEGQTNALTAGQVFTFTNQQAITFVNRFVPNENGISAFEESDFGTVAVQNTGDFDQRTFCFSYTLADLGDGEFPNTRDTLLGRICNFFDMITSVHSPVEEKLEFKVYPNPTQSICNISYYLSEDSHVSINIYDITGKIVNSRVNEFKTAGKQQYVWNASGMPAGIYFVQVRAGNKVTTRKMIKQ